MACCNTAVSTCFSIVTTAWPGCCCTSAFVMPGTDSRALRTLVAQPLQLIPFTVYLCVINIFYSNNYTTKLLSHMAAPVTESWEMITLFGTNFYPSCNSYPGLQAGDRKQS